MLLLGPDSESGMLALFVNSLQAQCWSEPNAWWSLAHNLPSFPLCGTLGDKRDGQESGGSCSWEWTGWEVWVLWSSAPQDLEPLCWILQPIKASWFFIGYFPCLGNRDQSPLLPRNCHQLCGVISMPQQPFLFHGSPARWVAQDRGCPSPLFNILIRCSTASLLRIFV